MKLDLPLPQPHHVEKFAKMIKEQKGIDLSPQEALDQCISLTHYVFLTKYVLPCLKAATKEFNKGKE